MPYAPAALLPPPPSSWRERARRVADFLLWSWWGRALLAAIALQILAGPNTALPCGLEVISGLVLFGFCVVGLWRLGRFLVRTLLWRIRTKLLLSYLFIAVVPVVLLLILFGLVGVMFSGLVASHIVSADLVAKAAVLQAAARTALAAGPSAAAPETLARLFAPAREIHPDIAFAWVGDGRVIASSGEAPHVLPAWVKGPGMAGIVYEGDADELRAVAMEGTSFVVLDAPIDARLFEDLRTRMGIQFLSAMVEERGEVEQRGKGVQIKVGDRRVQAQASAPGEGMPFVATPERRRWTDGEVDLEPLAFRFQPYDLARNLSPATLNMTDMLAKALAAVAGVFLAMYFIALSIGLVLARSITKSIHELHRGTDRLRRGNFGEPIRVHSRDQLGELADSFNVMSESIQDLLREQADKERLEEELRIARQIQMSLLPQGTVTLPGLRVAALCLPAAEVGGDYYDLLPLSPTRMGVLVADVSGKGTSAALYMAELKGLVLSLSRIYESPARLLGEANRILAANMDPRSFITMTYAVVDVAAKKMWYARAGHNPLLHLRQSDGSTRVLTPPGLGLGMDRGDRFEEILEEAEVALESGDVFLFFTDGLSEAMNTRAELFGERRLRDILEEHDKSGEDEYGLKDRILAEVRRFVGDAAQHDDMTMVLLKVV